MKKKKEETGSSSLAVEKAVSDDVLSAAVSDVSDHWVLDSGASFHMTPNRDYFSSFIGKEGNTILMGNDASCRAMGVGTVKIRMFDGVIRTLTGVHYVPGLRKSLISLGQLASMGCKVTLEKDGLKVSRGALILMKGDMFRNLYLLKGTTVLGETCVGVDSSRALDATRLWHLRLGHISEKGLELLRGRKMIKGNFDKLDFCQECVLGKQTKVSFGVGLHRSERVLDYVHTDVWGPVATASIGGAKYFISFIDDFSRKVWVYVMKAKSESFEMFKAWKVLVENQSGSRLKVLRSDNGGEFVSKEFLDFCRQHGIERHFTTPGDPQSNGVAERMNRTLLEKARCLRLTAGLSRGFWAEALSTAAHIINRIPCSAIDGKIPEEQWRGKAVYLGYFRIFGCPVYVHHTGDDKLEARAYKGIFLGYTDGIKGYRIWHSTDRKIVHSRHVTFDESAMFNPKEELPTTAEVSSKPKELEQIPIIQPISRVVDAVERPIDAVDGTSQDSPQVPSSSVGDVHETRGSSVQGGAERSLGEAIPIRASRRNIRPPDRYGDWQYANLSLGDQFDYALHVVHDEPFDLDEALKSSDSSKWLCAMEEELESLKKNKTWELVPPPQGSRAIGCKWVFKVKDDGRYKARLVAKGFSPRKGLEYCNTRFYPILVPTLSEGVNRPKAQRIGYIKGEP